MKGYVKHKLMDKSTGLWFLQRSKLISGFFHQKWFLDSQCSVFFAYGNDETVNGVNSKAAPEWDWNLLCSHRDVRLVDKMFSTAFGDEQHAVEQEERSLVFGSMNFESSLENQLPIRGEVRTFPVEQQRLNLLKLTEKHVIPQMLAVWAASC